MDFSNITAEYKFKTELHAHSFPVSKCGKFPSDEVVRIYASAGCDTLTLTNHLTEAHLLLVGAENLKEYYLSDYYAALEAAKGLDIDVALGVEIRFAGTTNDYLVYGVSPDDIEKMIPYIQTDIQTFYREFKNDKNLILHAHPFRSNMEPTPLDSVDGIETFNSHPGHNSRISIATKFARDNDLLVSGGSDFHEEGRHATCILRTKNRIRDSFDVAEALKSKDIIFDLSGHIVIPYIY